MVLWNQKYLGPPPTNTYKASKKELDLTKLRNALETGISHFKNEDFLIRETALLNRIIYRMNLKIKHSKDFKSIEKVNHCLKIYFKTNIIHYLNKLLELVPKQYTKVTYLPTRNMIYYILVRLQGLTKLMVRIYDTCKIAAYQVNIRFSTGHYWKIAFIIFAVISRIFILVKFNTKFLCELYGKLLPHCTKLESIGKNWLPKDYILPHDLREWLDVQWVYEEDYVDLTLDSSTNKLFDILNLVDDGDDDIEISDEFILVEDDFFNDRNARRRNDNAFTKNKMRGFSINEEDIGEEIIELDESASDKSASIKTPKNIMNYRIALEDVGEEIDDPFYIVKDCIPREVGQKISDISGEHYQTSATDNNKEVLCMEDNGAVTEDNIIIIPDTPVVSRQAKNVESHVSKIINKSNCMNLSRKEITKKERIKKKKHKMNASNIGNPFFKEKDLRKVVLNNNYVRDSNLDTDSNVILIPDTPKIKQNRKIDDSVIFIDDSVIDLVATPASKLSNEFDRKQSIKKKKLKRKALENGNCESPSKKRKKENVNKNSVDTQQIKKHIETVWKVIPPKKKKKKKNIKKVDKNIEIVNASRISLNNSKLVGKKKTKKGKKKK